MTTNIPPDLPDDAAELPAAPPELPELSDDAIARIEDAVFTQIAEEREGAHAHTATRRRSRRRGWLTAGGVAAAFAVGVLVTPPLLNVVGPVSAGSSAASAPSGSTAESLPQTKSFARDAAQSADSTLSRVNGATSTADAQRDVIRTGSATLQVTDVRAAADALGALATKYGGFVESQQIGSTQPPAAYTEGIMPYPQGDGWVSLRVPSADLTAVMDAVRAQGTVLSTSIGTNDVTTMTTDLRAQVASLTTSVERLTQLMSQASSVADLLTAETALTDRQAQLQSAQQQLKSLESQVEMSSVQVTLMREVPVSAEPDGFGAGIAAGWHGLIVSLNALVIAIGFALPWLAVLAVIVLLIWGIVRLRRARRAGRAEHAAATE